MDNSRARVAGAEMLRGGMWGHNLKSEKARKLANLAGVREVPVRTRWTTAEKSARWRNACARFVEGSIVGPMRGLLGGAHRHQQGGGELVWHYQCADGEAPSDVSAHSGLHKSSSQDDLHTGANRRLYADDVFEIFAADDSVPLGSHDSTADEWDLSCPATLEITVLGARNIKAGDGTGTSDPYVRLHIGSPGQRQSKRTRTLKRTLQPEWHETFSFEIDTASRREHLALECMDEDFASPDDSLGTASVALATLKPNVHSQFWCRLAQGATGTTKGEVEVRCTLSRCGRHESQLKAGTGVKAFQFEYDIGFRIRTDKAHRLSRSLRLRHTDSSSPEHSDNTYSRPSNSHRKTLVPRNPSADECADVSSEGGEDGWSHAARRAASAPLRQGCVKSGCLAPASPQLLSGIEEGYRNSLDYTADARSEASEARAGTGDGSGSVDQLVGQGTEDLKEDQETTVKSGKSDALPPSERLSLDRPSLDRGRPRGRKRLGADRILAGNAPWQA